MRGTSAGLAIELRALATEARLRDLRMVYEAGLGHIGGEFSAIDILTALYFGVLRIDPHRPDWPDRDRFVLSKGHAAAALYVTLAGGRLLRRRLSSTTFQAPLSRLGGHPDRTKLPGVETNTGPLGHGLPGGRGHRALAAQLDGTERRTFVLSGDGELQEGSMWEAAMAAGHFGLDGLTAHRRPQRSPAGRPHRVDHAPGAARRQLAGVRLARARGRRSRPRAAAGDLSRDALRAGPAKLRDRTHAQGPRRLLHQRPGRLASPRAHALTSTQRATAELQAQLDQLPAGPA